MEQRKTGEKNLTFGSGTMPIPIQYDSKCNETHLLRLHLL
jgi:hypothetical protein